MAKTSHRPPPAKTSRRLPPEKTSHQVQELSQTYLNINYNIIIGRVSCARSGVCSFSSGLREGGKGRKQMASVTHLGIVVKCYGGISNFWRERLGYLKNMGIKYILKKKDTYQINTDVSKKGKLKIRQIKR
jgi:hypothetical protein